MPFISKVRVTFNDEIVTFANKEKNITIKYSLKEKIFKNGCISVKSYIPELISYEALAFDHAQIIIEGLMRLRNKTQYSDVAFNLMPKEFTLPDLQRVYEIILGKQLYKTSFKRSINDKIKAVNKKGVSITGNKLSELYVYSNESQE